MRTYEQTIAELALKLGLPADTCGETVANELVKRAPTIRHSGTSKVSKADKVDLANRVEMLASAIIRCECAEPKVCSQAPHVLALLDDPPVIEGAPEVETEVASEVAIA